MELHDRCLVIRDILWEISNLYDLIECMSMGESAEDEPLIEQNDAAFFIWRALAKMQIIHMDKLLDKKGKFSMQKVINLAKEANRNLDFEWLEIALNSVVDSYNEFEMKFVRDKYIAHRDIVEKEIDINIHRSCIIKNGLNIIYNGLAKAINLEEYVHEHNISNNLQSVIRLKRES